MNREQIEAYNADLAKTVVLLQWIAQHADRAAEALEHVAQAAANVAEQI